MLMIPTALQEQERDNEAPLDTSNEQPGQNTTCLPSDAGRFEEQDLTDREDHGTVAELHSAAVPEHRFDGDQHSEGAQHAVLSSSSGALQDGGDEDQLLHTPGASTQVPEDANGTPSE